MGIIPADKAKVKPGDKFDKWTVLGMPLKIKSIRQTVVVCKCSCGRISVVNQQNLTRRLSRSCGCLSIETHTKHGLASRQTPRSRLYGIWVHINGRCKNTNDDSYVNYGGRGIGICEAWSDFRAFRDWAESAGYKNGLTIERRDVNRGYCPENCIWATMMVQGQNRRNTVKHEAFGEKKTVREWFEDERCVCRNHETLKNRLRKNAWEPERAITTPAATPGRA